MNVWYCPNCHRERITEDNVTICICKCGESFELISHPVQIDRDPIELLNKEIHRLITQRQRYEVLKRQKWRCNSCGESLKYNGKSKWEGQTAHIDHIWPYSKKEDYPNEKLNINETANLQALCPSCNIIKSNKEIN